MDVLDPWSNPAPHCQSADVIRLRRVNENVRQVVRRNRVID